MTNPRKTYLEVKYNHQNITEEISANLVDWTMTDNLSGEVDDLQIKLEDTKELWMNAWFPRKGSLIHPTLVKTAWSNTTIKTPQGRFEVDGISGNGPPSVINIQALSIPESNSLRGQQKYKVWEKATLKKVAEDIAKANKLKLVWQADVDNEKERYEQDFETDLSFLYRLFKDDGLCLKISNNSIVVLDEADYEAKPIVEKIRRHSLSKDIIKVEDYDFNTSLIGTYAACTVHHYDSKKKRTIKATYTPKNVQNNIGRILSVKQEVKSQAEALKLAKKKLREANKNATTVNLEVTSVIHIDAGMTFELIGFGRINGKYIATRVIHRPNSISLNLRRCLEGY